MLGIKLASIFVITVSVFALLQARGPMQLLNKNDTLFFFGLLFPICLLVILWISPDAPRLLAILPCVLSAFILFQALYSVEGEGTVLESKYQLPYPITVTDHKDGVLIELSRLRHRFLFFTKAIALGKEKKLAISFDNSETIRAGEQIKFRAFSAVAPGISNFPFLEAQSVFSYVVPAQH